VTSVLTELTTSTVSELPPTVTPLPMAVVVGGAPLSGKSSIASRLGAQYLLSRVSPEGCVTAALAEYRALLQRAREAGGDGVPPLSAEDAAAMSPDAMLRHTVMVEAGAYAHAILTVCCGALSRRCHCRGVVVVVAVPSPVPLFVLAPLTLTLPLSQCDCTRPSVSHCLSWCPLFLPVVVAVLSVRCRAVTPMPRPLLPSLLDSERWTVVARARQRSRRLRHLRRALPLLSRRRFLCPPTLQ
jgi:hypothetical protein